MVLLGRVWGWLGFFWIGEPFRTRLRLVGARLLVVGFLLRGLRADADERVMRFGKGAVLVALKA